MKKLMFALAAGAAFFTYAEDVKTENKDFVWGGVGVTFNF